MCPCNAKHWCEELKQGLVGVVCACGLQTEVASVLCQEHELFSPRCRTVYAAQGAVSIYASQGVIVNGVIICSLWAVEWNKCVWMSLLTAVLTT